MRLRVWAVTGGGALVALGLGWVGYLTVAVYSYARSCQRGVLCGMAAPFWDNPLVWLGLIAAMIGAPILAAGIAGMILVRLRIRRAPEAPA